MGSALDQDSIIDKFGGVGGAAGAGMDSMPGSTVEGACISHACMYFSISLFMSLSYTSTPYIPLTSLSLPLPPIL